MRRWIMKKNKTIPVNTLDEALRTAEILVNDLSNPESQVYRRYRIFSALASDDHEGLIAFLIWRARGEIFQKLTHCT